ncbi:hypothetical protein ABB37_02822 [Leptomonas pyrrhocoris]|uniref:Prokaryotic-type class I peptide chain release factors domain-containing protein n=1 Tax=Leptomonas pyrrhocoris TaxID=157538 RepID=A0A0M9G6A7_LEPPY|nr:hypothetical protein ABB37_02822 [Leptomonas pyrrhocoris]KPA83116.1 hypothetical protein ABB37_02822 [Leptomonas pyrrhocoris]|eukprot:XP_015661555.1 hypothetical protein ABB37_02822 [Leptomonas pyrrhocoris]
MPLCPLWSRRPPLRGLRLVTSPPVSTTLCAAPCLLEVRRASHVSSFKHEGYYRLADPRHISIDPCVYETRTMRGSGPGGQGVNSSSNKVELRADMEMLSDYFDEELLAALRHNEAGASLTSDGTTIVVSCHEHRSGLQNKAGCIHKLQELLHKASWVPPVEADPIERPTRLVTEHKAKRRQKSNANRMTRAARSGSW